MFLLKSEISGAQFLIVLDGENVLVVGQFFGNHQVIRQLLKCHYFGFKSVRVVIFPPFFENTCIFNLVR